MRSPNMFQLTVLNCLMVGCIGRHPELRFTPLNKPVIPGDLGIEDDMGLPKTDQAYVKINELCRNEAKRLKKKFDDADDFPIKVKTITGAVTGFVGTMGAASTLASGLATSATESQPGMPTVSSGDTTRTAAIAGVTAGLTLVGGLITSLITPGG